MQSAWHLHDRPCWGWTSEWRLVALWRFCLYVWFGTTAVSYISSLKCLQDIPLITVFYLIKFMKCDIYAVCIEFYFVLLDVKNATRTPCTELKGVQTAHKDTHSSTGHCDAEAPDRSSYHWEAGVQALEEERRASRQCPVHTRMAFILDKW